MNSICHKTTALKWLSFGSRDVVHVQRAEDKIRYPTIITTTVIIVMMMNMRWLLFLLSLANEFSCFPQSFPEHFSCVSNCPVLFWHFCQGAVWWGERVYRLTLGLGRPAGCRLPRGCRHPCLSLCCTQGHHWSAHWALYSRSLGQAFREIDCSWFPADWATSVCLLAPPMSTLTSLFNYPSRPSAQWPGHR